MQVKEVMEKDVKVINEEKSLADAARMMKDGNYGSLPVEKSDRLAGMITDRDIAIRAVAQGIDVKSAKVRDFMSSGIDYCFEDEPIEAACKKMSLAGYRRLPVLNKEKRLVGIVSLADLLNTSVDKDLAYKTLKEIGH